MSAVTHILVIVTYAIVAAAAGLILSQSLTGLPVYASYSAAAAGFIVAVLGHEIILRRRDNRQFSTLLEDAMDELEEMRALNHHLIGDLSRAREEMATLCEVVEDAAQGANRTLVREVKVLQEQLVHLANKKPQLAARARAKPPTPEKNPAQVTKTAPVDHEVGETDADAGAGDATGGGAISIPDAVLEEEDVLNAAREALESNRIELFLQPVVSLPQRKTRFYEAYSRLRTETGTLLTPDRYLDFAKDAGLIDTIDNLLLFRCVQLVRRIKKRRSDIAFFINISSNTLFDTDFLTQFAEFLQSNRALAPGLIFEFAQRDVRHFNDDIRDQLRRLARRGFRFSMDQVDDLDIDVPSLEAIGFGFVKVPAHLLMADPSDTGAQFHPRDLKKLLERSSIDLIADKIETEHQVIEILEFDVDYGQGYLFGEPRQAPDDARMAA